MESTTLLTQSSAIATATALLSLSKSPSPSTLRLRRVCRAFHRPLYSQSGSNSFASLRNFYSVPSISRSPFARVSNTSSFSASSGGDGGDSGGLGGAGGGGGKSEGEDFSGDVATDVSTSSPDAIILNVGGMSCGGCVASVKRILESQPQVSSATVDLTTETAVVWPVADAKCVPDWRKHLGELLAKHLTTCGFTSNLRDGDVVESEGK